MFVVAWQKISPSETPDKRKKTVRKKRTDADQERKRKRNETEKEPEESLGERRQSNDNMMAEVNDVFHDAL